MATVVRLPLLLALSPLSQAWTGPRTPKTPLESFLNGSGRVEVHRPPHKGLNAQTPFSIPGWKLELPRGRVLTDWSRVWPERPNN